MPLYDAICKSCNNEFEYEKSYSETKKPKCPKCGSIKIRNKISIAPTIKFVGDGFTRGNQEIRDE